MLQIVIRHSLDISRADAAQAARIISSLFTVFGYRGRNAAAADAVSADYAQCVRTLTALGVQHAIEVSVESVDKGGRGDSGEEA